MGKFKNYLTKKAMGDGAAEHGPFNRESETYVENLPWDMILSNGIFRDHSGRVWKYFRSPEDVRTEWLRDPSEALDSQSFFLDLMEQLGATINNQVDRVRGDIRRRYHSQTTRGEIDGIRPPSDFSEAHADYMRRIGNGQLTRAVWNTYIGVEILPSETPYEAHGFVEQAERWLDGVLNPNESEWLELARDLQQVDDIFLNNGFSELDFEKFPEDFQALTAWFAEEDYRYHMPASIRTARIGKFVHGKSLLTPKYGEVTFHALKPRDTISVQDPLSGEMQWAKSLFEPSHNVVSISIRGEIRAPKIADNLLEIKRDKRESKVINDLDDGTQQVMNAIQSARDSIRRRGYPLLDNTEIVIGSIVPDVGRDNNSLFQSLSGSQFDALLLKDRQIDALMSTIAAFPNGVLRIPKGSKKRPHLSNVALPGFIGLSGLYRAHRPAAATGIFLGFAVAGREFLEIYTEMDAATKHNSSPVMYISGRPGSGKTQQALQMLGQMAYEGLPVWYLNLKKTDTLKPTFDLIGGFTISMNREFLAKSPGIMDPMFFLKHPADVQSILCDALFTSMRLYNTTDDSQAARRRQKINREILERAGDDRNKTSRDVIFGNAAQDPRKRTTPISDEEVLEYVRDAMEASPFWRAFIATAENAELASKVRQGASLLVEWDQSMSLPDSSKHVSDYTDSEIEMVNSAVTIFRYATETVAGSGGGVFVDESHALKGSQEARRILNTAAREWRQADIVLVLMSQRLTDWLGSPNTEGAKIGEDDLSSFVERYIFMAISENGDEDFEWFSRITGQIDSPEMRSFLAGMGATSAAASNDDSDSRRGRGRQRQQQGNKIPLAWVHDQIAKWSGPIVCGPFPELELNVGRTDKAGQAARRQETEDYMRKFEESADDLRDAFSASPDNR